MNDKEKHGMQIDELTNLESDEDIIDVLEYGDNPFVVITKENQDEVIDKYCDAVFIYNLTDNEEEFIEMLHDSKTDTNMEGLDHDKLVLGKKFLKEFLKKLPKPITIVQEMYHIDRSYRDTYYMYFSNQHFMNQQKIHSTFFLFLHPPKNMTMYRILQRKRKVFLNIFLP